MATSVGQIYFQIAADIKGISGQLKTLESNFNTSFNRIQRSAATVGRSILGGLGVGISAAALVGFTKSVIDAAGKLTDLADQTGFNAQTLSGLKSTVEEAGSSIDSFARAIFTAQKNLGAVKSDTEEAAVAAKALGLDYKQLIQLSPEEFFDAIATALSKVENVQQRNALGARILGRSYMELAPIIGQVAGKLDQFRAQGISEEDLRRLDSFGDLWTKLSNNLQIIAAGPLADIVFLIEKLFGLSARTKLLDSLMDVEDEINRIDKMLERRKSLREKGFGFFTAPESDDVRALEQRRELLAEQRRIDQELNKLNAPTGGRPGAALVPAAAVDKKKTEDATRSFLDGLKKQADQLKVNIAEETRGADAARTLGLQFEFAAAKAKMLAEGKPIPPGVEAEFQKWIVAIESLSRELQAAKFEADRFAERARMDDLDSSSWLTFSEDVENLIIKPLQAAKQAWDDARLDQLGAAFDQDSAEFLTANEGVAAELQRQAAESLRLWTQVANGLEVSFERSFEGVLTSTEDFGDRMAHFARNIGLSIAFELQKALIVNPLMDILFGGRDQGGNRAGGFLSTAASFIGGLFTGKQHGGPVFGQRPYLVGEAGPELFVPASAGNIIPNHNFMPASVGVPGGSGGVTIVQNNQIDARGAQRGVDRDIERTLAKTKKEAVNEAIVAVSSERSRSNNFAKRFS